MDRLQLMERRRSMRKYEERQVSREYLEKILKAGLFAPNAGGRQSPFIIAIRDFEFASQIGRLNMSTFDRKNLVVAHVSSEQPGIIGDPEIRNAFYNAPAVCAILTPNDFVYGIPDAYCCANSMVLMATSLNIASCIVARHQETFATPEGQQFMQK